VGCVTVLVRATAAQKPPLNVPPGTVVTAVNFRFTNGHALDEDELRKHLALSAPAHRNVIGRVKAFAFGGDRGAPPRFDALELQRDRERLRRFYARNGFPGSRIDYDVALDAKKRQIEITYGIDQGRPVLVRDIVARATGNGDVDSASAAARRRTFETMIREERGSRYTDAQLQGIERRVRERFRRDGYPFVKVTGKAVVDTANRSATVELDVDRGTRAWVGSVAVQGNEQISQRTILRELPFRAGDPFSSTSLAAGRRAVEALDIVRSAQTEVTPSAEADSLVDVRLAVQEAPLRVVSGEIGYATSGGITGQATWAHRNFTGGARVLTASIRSQTGWLAIDANPDILTRGAVSLKQPYVLNPRLNAILSPFVQYRDDYRDRSLEFGTDASLVYQLSSLNALVFKYTYSRRDIYQYNVGDLSELDILSQIALIALLDSLQGVVRKSLVTLSANLGRLDDLANPRRGWVVRPSFDVTLGGPSVNTIQYTRLDVSAAAYHPLSRQVVLAARFAAGRIFPFGNSSPVTGSDTLFQFLSLRDVAYTAGGTTDVRGWENRLLGPKIPDIKTSVNGADTTITADRYTPIGGLARWTATLELRLPFPRLGPSWGTFTMLDAGRVWNPDPRYGHLLGDFNTDGVFWGSGLGVDYRTVVGAIRIGLGVKINPSPYDLRDPGDVARAVADGQPLSSVPESWRRRLNLNFALGVSF